MPRARLVFLPLDDFFLTPASTVEAWAGAVAARVPELDVVVAGPRDDLGPAVADADAVFGTLTPELLAGARRLRWLQAPAAAPPPGYWFDELVSHPVVVTNLRGVYRENLANHAMAAILAFARGYPTALANQRRHEWQRDAVAQRIIDLAGTCALLVGVGQVGTVLARRCRAFDMRVVGVDARPEQVDAPLDALHGPDALDAVLGEADWVVLSVPDTPDTVGMIDRDRLRAMRRDAVLVNVGRGSTVRLDDLTDALEAGEIGGAALDVFETEPLPPGHPLWRRDDVIVTPHVAGFGQDTDAEREAVLVDNARRFVDGEPLRNVVDKALRF